MYTQAFLLMQWLRLSTDVDAIHGLVLLLLLLQPTRCRRVRPKASRTYARSCYRNRTPVYRSSISLVPLRHSTKQSSTFWSTNDVTVAGRCSLEERFRSNRRSRRRRATRYHSTMERDGNSYDNQPPGGGTHGSSRSHWPWDRQFVRLDTTGSRLLVHVALFRWSARASRSGFIGAVVIVRVFGFITDTSAFVSTMTRIAVRHVVVDENVLGDVFWTDVRRRIFVVVLRVPLVDVHRGTRVCISRDTQPLLHRIVPCKMI